MVKWHRFHKRSYPNGWQHEKIVKTHSLGPYKLTLKYIPKGKGTISTKSDMTEMSISRQWTDKLINNYILYNGILHCN
jgi:hypothetical protein